MPPTLALTPAELRTVEALARVIVPQAFQEGAPGPGPLVEARMRLLPAATAADLRLVLRLLSSPVARLAISGRWTDWALLDEAARLRAFERWGHSLLPPARTAYQALRRLLLATWYASPGGQRDAGLRPPLHTRMPELGWEGPMAAPVAGTVVAMGSRTEQRVTPLGRTWHDHVTTGARLRGDFHLTADVVVIGSGAGGSVAAAKLAEAGLQVVILEGGPYVTPEEMTEDEGTLFPRLFAEGGARATTDLSVSVLQGAVVGGGTLVNWMLMLRTPEHVLSEWRDRFGLDELTSAHLAPHFEAIEATMHVDDIPDAAHSPSNRLLLDGARRLGWRAVPARLNTRGCVRAGSCSLGCRYGAKQSALETWLPRAFAHDARLLANTFAERIERVERDPGRGPLPMKRVHARTIDEHTGREVGTVTVDARRVVVAAGAIETPALLQRSGLGGGAVGRFLRLHPTTAVMGIYPQETYPLAGLPLTAMCDEFVRSRPHDYGFWLEVPALGPGLAAVSLPGVGPLHREAMQQLAHTVPFIALTRDGADLDDSNGRVVVDRSGRTRISYRLGPTDQQTMRESLVAAGHLHLENGATHAYTLHEARRVLRSRADLEALRVASCAPNALTVSSAHVNGTCRMGTDPRTCGATPQGERYGARGVYIADGSLLPTAPGVNPQETVMALASLVTDHILRASA